MVGTTDEEARQAILAHHEELVEGVRSRTAALTEAVDRGTPYDAARAELVAYMTGHVLPHAAAEEATLYAAAERAGLAEQVADMVDEHHLLEDRADSLARTDDARDAAALARAWSELFDRHVRAENDVILPVLLGTPGISLADLLSAMHAAYTAARHRSEP